MNRRSGTSWISFFLSRMSHAIFSDESDDFGPASERASSRALASRESELLARGENDSISLPQTRLMLHFAIQENEYQPEDASLSRQYRPDLGLWIWLRSQYCSFVPYLSRYSRSLMFCSSGRRVWAPSTRRVRFSFRGRASAKFYLLSWSERFLMNALVSNFHLLLLLDALLKLPG